MYSSLSWFLARGVFRTLTSYPDPGEGDGLVGDLATDAGTPNDDATEWTFTLRSGIRFGPALGGERIPDVTGTEITCDDIKYGIERIFLPSVEAGYPFYYDVLVGAEAFSHGRASDIAGIECIDDKTIAFHLREPTTDWPSRLAMPASTPVRRAYASRYDRGVTSSYPSHVLFSGPYFVARHEDGGLRLERSPDWDPASDAVRGAYVDGVDWRFGFGIGDGIAKVTSGEYDLAADLPPTGKLLERIVTDPSTLARLIHEPEGCIRYLFVNTKVRPFDDALVRRAVNVAIDRANLKRIFGGPATGPIASSVIPPGIDGYLSPARFAPFATYASAGDIDRGRRLMARAGYPDGYDRPITAVGSPNPPFDAIFDSVVGDLRRLGFSHVVTLQPTSGDEYSKYYSRLSSRTAVGTSTGWCKDYPGPYSILGSVLSADAIDPSSSRNYSFLDDDRLERAIGAAEAEVDPAAATALWEKANRVATESAAWVPWSWDETAIVYGTRVRDAHYLPFVTQIDWVNARVRRANGS
ncbi:MAG: peptide/nickel transport system substrate-binding protein [Actinomycetota bacterium]|nr:peptide/nickel transport system substrate-binding protein [Actinomycetota bacterium]